MSQAIDPRLEGCSKKMMKQYDLITKGKVPDCVDTLILKKIPDQIGVFKQFYDEMPSTCKKVSKENISDCLKNYGSLLQDKSKDLQLGIMNSIRLLTKSLSSCWYDAAHNIKKLDYHVLNGCKDL